MRNTAGIIYFSFFIELFRISAIVHAMKRNAIETLDSSGGAGAAHLNPVETGVIHLFVQLSRALGHPCKIYNILAVGAPVIYIGPKSSHVTEILDALGDGKPQARVEHGQAEDLARQIQGLQRQMTDGQRSLSTETTGAFSKNALLPKIIAAIEGTGPV
jgi:hypothetical protein